MTAVGHASAVEDAAAVLGGRARRDVPIGPLTTYRVGGRAALFVEAADEADLDLARQAVMASAVAVLVVGRGSNLLVADAGFPGLVVTLGPGFDWVDWSGRPRLRAGAAVGLPVLARQSAAAGLTGFEWAVGIPGSLGGAVRMNAGGHGSDMAASLLACRVVDLAGGADGDVPAERLAYGYRYSSLPPTAVVTEATLVLAEGDAGASRAEVAEIVRWRREHQPGGQNAGSVFTNPPGDAAGRLVEAAGCKALRVGSAQVSPKHANFIQADAQGSAADVVALMAEVRRRVLDVTGVTLTTEVRLVGFDHDPNCAPEDEGR